MLFFPLNRWGNWDREVKELTQGQVTQKLEGRALTLAWLGGKARVLFSPRKWSLSPFFKIKLELSCLTVLYWSLLCRKVNQLYTDVHLLFVTTEHWVELPVLYSGFSLVTCFLHGSVCMWIPVSEFIPLALSPIGVHTFVLYVCVSISAFHICSSVPFF